MGVYYNEKLGKFTASCKIGNKKSKFLGRFDTEDEAFNSYIEFKKIRIKDAAEKYFKCGSISEQVKDNLNNWEITNA